jgi:hypothetical protein
MSMNERDYLIMESMTIAAGAFVVGTIISMMLIYRIIPDLTFFVIMAFIGFATFFFGLVFHMKRRIFMLEMEALAKDHTDPQQNSGSKK